MKIKNVFILLAALGVLATNAFAQTEVSVIATNNESIRASGPGGSPWFHNAQGPGDFAQYGISSFDLSGEAYGGPVTAIEKVTISYTQANASFTTDGPIEFFISFDPAISAGDYSGLMHSGAGNGINDANFADDPTTQSLGTSTFTQVESGTVDTYTLDVTAVKEQLMAAINDSAPFSLIIAADIAGTAVTYAGIENNSAPDSIILSVTALGGGGGGESALMITGVMDGTFPGGLPKGIELLALEDIADLSVYGVGSANNGGGTDGEELTLEGSAMAGDFIYIASEETEFTALWGMAPDFVSDAANINGDDAIELFLNGEVVDLFGDIDVDGSGEPWEHLDSWAYRTAAGPPDGMFVLENWSFGGVDALDGLDGPAMAAAVPFGTFEFTPVETPDPYNLIPNPNFTMGEDGKDGWITYLNVFDPTGVFFKYGTDFDTDTAVVGDKSVVLSAHPGWNDNGNGPADLGDVIENSFYVQYDGVPEFGGEYVTFSGSISVDTPLDPGSTGIAFIKVLDTSWGLAQIESQDVELADGSFSLTMLVPTENMNAFQIGFSVTGVAASNGAIKVSDLRMEIVNPNNLLLNPNFDKGDDGKDEWVSFLNVFDPTGANYKYGTGWDTGTAAVGDRSVTLSAHPGWTDNGNGPADLGDVIENNFYTDFGGTPPFAGETISFSGSFSVDAALDPGTTAVAFIKVFDGSWGLAAIESADVETSGGSFELTMEVPTENMNGLQVGFAITGVAGSAGSIMVSDLSVETVEIIVIPDPALMITGVMDGTLPGGLPKGIELYAYADIPDLSFYGVGSANNGGGSDGEELTLEGSAMAGDYIYIASDETEFMNVWGIAPDFVSDAANINGDDAIELFLGGEVIDLYGEIDVDGNGTDWEYLDSWAYRTVEGMPDGTFDIGNWTLGGVDALDGLDAAGIANAVPFGFYPNPIPMPEPLPWAGAEVGDFIVSDWFGAFEVSTDDWLNHTELLWIYVGNVMVVEDMWVYSVFLDAWVWSNMDAWPLVYNTASSNWVYYFNVPDVGVWVWDYNVGEWEFFPQG